MNTVVALILAVIILLVVVGFLKGAAQRGRISWPVSARPLMNGTEWKVFERLQEALPNHAVFAQVALSQLIEVRSGKNHQWARNKIFRKVVDFVILRPDRSVLAVIEVDGPTHLRPSRQRADTDKDAALIGAGYTLHRINAAALPSGFELQALLYPPPPPPSAGLDTPARRAPTL